MKRKLIVCMLSLLMAVAFVGQAHAGTKLLSLNFGQFSPGSDYDSTWDGEEAAGLVFDYISESYWGIEAAFKIYDAVQDSGTDRSVEGFELLATVQQPGVTFQPYLGIGYGAYDSTTSTTAWEDSQSAQGVVLRAGLRYYAGEKLCLGLHYSTVEAYSDRKSTDFGGDSLELSAGYVF